jgi:hypothetical protein
MWLSCRVIWTTFSPPSRLLSLSASSATPASSCSPRLSSAACRGESFSLVVAVRVMASMPKATFDTVKLGGKQPRKMYSIAAGPAGASLKPIYGAIRVVEGKGQAACPDPVGF